jgi:predicted transglutaminase-like cysteine proteinase
MFRKLVVGLATAATMALAGTPAMAARPPLGMTLFCLNYANECQPDTVGKVVMSEPLMAALVRVNNAVNGSMRYNAEKGVVDSWRVGGSTGDCEDYVLTKRAMLIAMGVPSGALRIATTLTRRGEPHAVLVVRTSRGDYILDNIGREVVTRSESGYRLNTMSGKDPMMWSAA